MTTTLKSRLDYDDLQHAPVDGKRYELVEGQLFVTPAPSPYHQRVSKRLQRQLEAYFEARKLGEVFNSPVDVILTTRDVMEPDIVVVTDPSQISRRGIEGPPAIVVEVLSPTTASIDRTIKGPRYAALGIPQYWIVNHEARRLECYQLSDGRYVLSAQADGDAQLAVAGWDGLTIDAGALWR